MKDGQNILVIGSATLANSLLQANLIDEFKFLIQPVVMGSGKRFFKDNKSARLQLVMTERLDRGVALLHYKSVESS